MSFLVVSYVFLSGKATIDFKIEPLEVLSNSVLSARILGMKPSIFIFDVQ